MGVNFKDIVVKKEISIPALYGKKLVVDGNNILYQFLSTIRQPDGTPLADASGNITSHLNGLFYRTTKLMQSGIKPVFVFDGKPPELKRFESERRAALKAAAKVQLEQARAQGDTESMKKYSMRTSRLTREMISESVLLLESLGVPVVMAPSEGEAQAAFMVKNGDVYAEISQDYDCLLFGVPRMIQNLTISERKKMKDKISYETIKPQMIDLKENLAALGLTQDELIVLGILVGTDFDVGGIKGIGPKKALDLVKKNTGDFDSLFKELKWDDYFDYDWHNVFDLFKNMPVVSDYSLVWKGLDYSGIKEILCQKHGFSEIRVDDAVDKLQKSQSLFAQKGLGDFF